MLCDVDRVEGTAKGPSSVTMGAMHRGVVRRRAGPRRIHADVKTNFHNRTSVSSADDFYE